MMNNKLWSVVLVCALVLMSQYAWAKRLGRGLSFGKQLSNVTQRSGTPPAQQAAAQAPAQNAPAQSSVANAAAAARRAWGGMPGGLAAGLGLAWLAISLGFGEGFAQLLMGALLAGAVVVVLGMVMRRRNCTAPSAGFAYQAEAGGHSRSDPVGSASSVDFRPPNVGNDASARPSERSTGLFNAAQLQATGGSRIGETLSGVQGWRIPAGFDLKVFLKASKANFLSLQDAWKRSDIPSLRAMMTDGILEQIQSQLVERERSDNWAVNKTEAVILEAHSLGIEQMVTAYMASVGFSGLIREDLSAGPNPLARYLEYHPAQNGLGWLACRWRAGASVKNLLVWAGQGGVPQ